MTTADRHERARGQICVRCLRRLPAVDVLPPIYDRVNRLGKIMARAGADSDKSSCRISLARDQTGESLITNHRGK